MAASVRSSEITNITSESTEWKLKKPPTVNEGDKIYAGFFPRRTAGLSVSEAPTGFTLVPGGSLQTGVESGFLYVKTATGSEPSEYNFKLSQVETGQGALVAVKEAEGEAAVAIANTTGTSHATGALSTSGPNLILAWHSIDGASPTFTGAGEELHDVPQGGIPSALAVYSTTAAGKESYTHTGTSSASGEGVSIGVAVYGAGEKPPPPAPTLQAEAAEFTMSTTASVSPTIPTHQENDILWATCMIWAPETAGAIADIPTPENWNKAGSVDLNGATKDGQIAWFWRRAPSSGTTVTFTRGGGWDTGNDTAYGSRVDVIRGCIAEGTPYDDFKMSSEYTTTNQNIPAFEVKGERRLAMIFEAYTSDTATAQFTALTGFTMGTQRGGATGTGGGARNARAEKATNVESTATTHIITTAGRRYAFCGVSFRPPEEEGGGKSEKLEFADEVALADAVVKAPGKRPADTVALADAVVKAPGKRPADTVALADGVTKALTKGTFADAVTLADATVKAIGKNFADTTALADELLRKAIGKTIADTAALADGVTKAVRKGTFADAVTLEDAAQVFRLKVLEFADSIELADSVRRAVGKVLGDSVTLADAVTKAVGKRPADSISLADATEIFKKKVLEFADSIELADSVRKAVGLNKADNTTLADALVKAVTKAPGDTVSLADSARKAVGKAPADSVTLADSLVKKVGKAFADTLTLADEVSLEGSAVGDMLVVFFPTKATIAPFSRKAVLTPHARTAKISSFSLRAGVSPLKRAASIAAFVRRTAVAAYQRLAKLG